MGAIGELACEIGSMSDQAVVSRVTALLSSRNRSAILCVYG